MIELIDSHAHYDDVAFDGDREALLEKLLRDDCRAIVNIGCDPECFGKTTALAEKYPRLFAAYGVHPEYADAAGEGFADVLERLAAHPKTVAIGEIGLDYHYGDTNREKQLEVFEKQLMLAEKLALPVIIHSRDAVKDTLDALKKHRPKGVVHCFSGSAETAREILTIGMSIGFTGVITFKNAKKAAEACAEIPLSRILLETDCPYMAPEPFRGERCDSSLIAYTAAKIAQIKGVSADEVIKTCAENTIRLFGLAKFTEMC